MSDTVIDTAVVKSEFCSQAAATSFRITCYGSSSAKTPERYLEEARSLGYILAKRGHVCVNGAGSFGCMAALNDGAVEGNGDLVGVIHEMFLVDNGYWGKKSVKRDGGAHPAFFSSEDGPLREIVVAKGDDLQQRKKLLVQNAEGLIVLPGGPGTWDELWEMACVRQLGLTQLPIVCVNVNNYYEPFRQMLDRAYEDKLIRLKPQQIVHFASTSEEAVRWIEGEAGRLQQNGSQNTTARPSVVKRSSFLSTVSWLDSGSDESEVTLWPQVGLTLAAGVACVAVAFARWN